MEHMRPEAEKSTSLTRLRIGNSSAPLWSSSVVSLKLIQQMMMPLAQADGLTGRRLNLYQPGATPQETDIRPI